jgi:hypothetical protein
MHVEIRRADPSKEFLTHENCFILEVANDSGDPDVSIARARETAYVSGRYAACACRLFFIFPGRRHFP